MDCIDAAEAGRDELVVKLRDEDGINVSEERMSKLDDSSGREYGAAPNALIVDVLARIELGIFEEMAAGDAAASRPGGTIEVALRARDGPVDPSWL